MNLTLRRIKKLVNKIDDELQLETSDLEKNLSRSVFVHDSNAEIERQLNEALAAWRTSLDRSSALQRVRQQLRELAGLTNASTGVNSLVTELRSLEQMRTIITRQLRRVPDARPDSTALSTRLTALRKRGEATRIEVSTYGGGDSTTINVYTLEQSDLDSLREQEKALKNRIEAVGDRLERINASVEVEIPAALEDALKTLELVPPVTSL